MHTKSLVLFLLGLILLGPLALRAERLSFSFYTNTEGLPQRQVLAITRDQLGYLWVGTYGGLSRFNGRRFITLRAKQGLSSNAIQDLVPIPGGGLWVGTSGGGVCFLQGLSPKRCFHSPETLTSEDVLDLEPDGAGGVWAGTFEGITHLDSHGTAKHFRQVDGMVLRNVWSIKNVGNRLLVGFAGGLAEIRDGRVQLLPVQVPGTALRALLPTSRWLYLGSERGLLRLPIGTLAGTPEALAENVFVQDLVGTDETVWVATRTGLLRWQKEQLQRITASQGLPSEVIHRLFLDQEGILWLGTEEGLVKLAPSPFTTFDGNDGLPHNFVRAIAEDDQRRLWVGTRNGLAVEQGPPASQRFRPVLTGMRVYHILPLPSGEVWVATNAGTLQLQGEMVRKIWREEQGLPDRFTFALAYDGATNSLWIGTWSGTVLLKNGQLTPVPPQVAAARPLSMHLDRRGRLWIGLRDGKVLLRQKDSTTRVLGAAEGLSDQVVWSITSDSGGVWLGTNGDGALYVTDRGVERWDVQRGLVDDFVWQVLPDRQGRVWFFTSQGLDRLEGGRIRHFGIQDGLPDLEGSASACFEDASGQLWFGTGSGLVRFDPQAENTPVPPPPVLLESATFAEGEPLVSGRVLPPAPGPVVFSLASLTLRNEKGVRFSYRLWPIQSSWSAPQSQGEITFAALGPGDYRFEAVAVDADGQRSVTPVTLPFAVARPWWQQPVALAGFLVLAVGSSLAYARVRLARLQARARKLEALVEQRTRELAEKAQQLAKLAETDELTGLPNRRKFFDTLRLELQRLWRAPQDSRLALLLIDLDNFKEINDSLGHSAGDRVLQTVAQSLAGAVRTTDTVARIGGDEFAVILPMTDRTGAAVVAQKVLATVAAARTEAEGKTLAVTATVGVAVVAPSAAFRDEEVTRLLQRADLALYAAKRRGGNSFLDDSETWA
ncbi:MAG: diguanylate cyclase [Thermoanaerobaculum sp.]|nr:diguanylate cyclase [Thermoanaerobaculum sp.]MDW7967020.1 diguanylate cyclase [Thermoanaerobaculum sp.]